MAKEVHLTCRLEVVQYVVWPTNMDCHKTLRGYNKQAFLLPSDATRPRASETVYIVQPETRLTGPGHLI